MSSAGREDSTPSFLSGGGELGQLMRGLDWRSTPLGPPQTWPQSLRTVVNILLTSRYAMWMGWGDQLTFLYNDAYRPTLGIKHPWALGSPAMEVWAEIWRDIGPRIETVLVKGVATYDEGLMLFLERSGFSEETYHTFSYSPLADDQGRVSGMLCVVTEETERILAERRMATLRELAGSMTSNTSERGVLQAVTDQLSANNKDLPFALTYLYENEGSAKLACAVGIDAGHPAAPERIPRDGDEPWPASELKRNPAAGTIGDLSAKFPQVSLPSGAWDKPPQQAVVVPLNQQGYDEPAGFLVVGLNPYCRYDDAYSGFVGLVAGQVSAGISNARAHDAERRRVEVLAELDRAKTAFFSNVSHEFRTPLTLMLGPVEDLLSKSEDQLRPENRELLEVVQRSGLRLQRLVNTLLDFARIEAGRAQAYFQPTDLATLTADLSSSFRSAMERAGLAFRVACAPLSEPAYVDRQMWEKIVLNLISNAFKYTFEGGVEIRLEEGEGVAQLSVIDTGIGIPASELPHLFERFHRVEGARGRTHEGTGIGLALVHELIKLHGGTVHVSSHAGSGSTFTVSLPLGSAHLTDSQLNAPANRESLALQADAYVEEALRWLPESGEPTTGQPQPAPAVSKQRAGLIRSRVLLADDNADMRNYARRLLSDRYDVIAVANGKEALDAALAEPPDLVLSDVMMPVLDGFGLLRELRGHERTQTIPILLLSARAGEESRVEGLDAGADDYMVKPFTARELLARVEAHLSLARMRRQADQARRFSEMRLSLALEATRLLVWEWDPATDRIRGSGQMEAIFGEVIETAAAGMRLIHPDDAQAYRTEWTRVTREGGMYHLEFRIIRPDTGEIVWLEERALGVTGDRGRVTQVMGVLIDVTERKAAEQEMRLSNEQLTRANRELEEFAYAASHDLQEPLRMINIYSQLLIKHQGANADDESIGYAQQVRRGVQRMEALIKDLLTYSRTVHPDQDEAVRVDLNAAFDEAIATLRPAIEETRAEIVKSTLPAVFGDQLQLALVFQNLFSNALKYRKNGTASRIEVVAEMQSGDWVVSVRDNGIGFDPKHSERIFGLFKRLHKDEYPGTGLGLAICKRILERYDGRIWATSEGEGKGSTFCFALRSAS